MPTQLEFHHHHHLLILPWYLPPCPPLW